MKIYFRYLRDIEKRHYDFYGNPSVKVFREETAMSKPVKSPLNFEYCEIIYYTIASLILI